MLRSCLLKVESAYTDNIFNPKCDKCLGKTCCHFTVHKVEYDEQENVDTEMDPKYKLKISSAGLKDLNSGKNTENTTSNDTNTTMKKGYRKHCN